MSKTRAATGKRLPSVNDLISRVAMFAPMGSSDREALATEARPHNFAADAQIFARGDAGLDVFIVATGRVRLSVLNADGKVLTFNNAGPGDVFGEMAAFDGAPRSADATAMVDTVVYSLPAAEVLRAFTATPEAARAAIVFLCGRVRTTSAQVEDIALHTIMIRLARFFLSALKLTKAPLGSRIAQIDIEMSQAELADLLGASRQKLNQALSHMAKDEVVWRKKNLYSCNVPKLKEIAKAD